MLRDDRRACRALGLALVASLLTAACSDDDGGDPVAESADEATAATTTTASPEDGQDGGAATRRTDDEVAEDERDAEDDERQVRAFEGIPDIVEEVEPSVVTVVTDSGLGSGVVVNTCLMVLACGRRPVRT